MEYEGSFDVFVMDVVCEFFWGINVIGLVKVKLVGGCDEYV